MACTLLEITCTAGVLDAAEAWRRIADVLAETLPPDTPFAINDVPRKLEKVGDYVAKAGVWNFYAVGAGYEFHFSPGGPREAAFLRMERAEGLDGEFWVGRLTESGWLLSARLADHDYERWQNMHDPRYFGVHGRSVQGLTLVPDANWPSRMIVDTSRNPGRREFRNGYIEAVGAVMWLGTPFAGVTEADLDTLRAADWCRVEEVRPGTLRVRTQDECFTSPEGREADLQNRLRATLFPVVKERFPRRQKRRPS